MRVPVECGEFGIHTTGISYLGQDYSGGKRVGTSNTFTRFFRSFRAIIGREKVQYTTDVCNAIDLNPQFTQKIPLFYPGRLVGI